MLLLRIFVLCLAAVAAAQNATEQCGACTDADCEVLESVKIGEACVDELCVQGAPVVGGDNNACTREELVDGVLVSVRIKECCRVGSNDCADFLPSPCHVSECIVGAEGATHGYCRHERVLGCCACDQDCPERPCFEAQCVAASPAHVATLLKFGDGASARMTPANSIEHSVSETAAGKMCEYTPIEDCCLRSTGAPQDGGEEDGLSCDSRAPEGTFGVCDKNCECQFIPTLEIECRTDDDCRADPDADDTPVDDGNDELLETLWRRTQPGDRAPKKRHPKKQYHRRKSGPCIAPTCSPQGLCVEEFDPSFDADGDGVPCATDCDDQDAEKGVFTYCAEGGDEYNADGDAFAKCGAPVERLCLAGAQPACPEPEQLSVNRTDVVQSVHNANLLVLRYNCDCCDDFPGLDETAICARDADASGEFACATNVTACVPQRVNGTAPPPSKPHKDDIDEQWGWPETSGATFDPEAANEACRAWAAEEQLEQPDEFVALQPDDLAEQCDECDNNDQILLAATTCFWDGDNDNSVHCSSDVDSIEQCCEQILTGEQANTQPTVLINFCECLATEDAATCGAKDDHQTPVLFEQCFCPVDFVSDPGDTIDECGDNAGGQQLVRCYKDIDQDCFADCSRPQDICVPFAAVPEQACQERGEIYLGAEPVEAHDARCDCNDKNFKERQLVACLPDEDQDTFPGADCAEKCSYDGKCPAGYIPLSNYEGDELRKRAVRSVERLLGKRHAPHHYGGHDKSKCDPLPANEHQHCPASQEVVALVGSELIDCCDIDSVAFPGSLSFLFEPTRCAADDYDFNCNGTPEKAYQCSTAEPTRDEYGRAVFTEANDQLLKPFTTVGILGSCQSDGTPVFGWLPEVSSGARKRQATVEQQVPVGCTAIKIIDILVDSSTDFITQSPATGECGVAVIGCVEQNDEWHEDCEICIATEQ